MFSVSTLPLPLQIASQADKSQRRLEFQTTTRTPRASRSIVCRSTFASRTRRSGNLAAESGDAWLRRNSNQFDACSHLRCTSSAKKSAQVSEVFALARLRVSRSESVLYRSLRTSGSVRCRSERCQLCTTCTSGHFRAALSVQQQHRAAGRAVHD